MLKVQRSAGATRHLQGNKRRRHSYGLILAILVQTGLGYATEPFEAWPSAIAEVL